MNTGSRYEAAPFGNFSPLSLANNDHLIFAKIADAVKGMLYIIIIYITERLFARHYNYEYVVDKQP